MYFYYNKNQMSNYSGFYFNYAFYCWAILSIQFFTK